MTTHAPSSPPGSAPAAPDDAVTRARAALDARDPAGALAILGPALASEPEDAALLTLAVAAARAEGDLAGAATYSRRLEALQPFNLPVGWLGAILAGRPPSVPVAMGMELPPPFVVEDDALPADWHDRIWRESFDALEDFAPAAVIDDDGQYADLESRSAKLIAEAEGAAREVGLEVVRRLPDLLPRLAVPGFEPGRVEVQVTLHTDGDFFRVHQDRPLDPDPSIAGRRVSFVYYMARRPRVFDGGWLRLYDTCAGSGTWRPERWTAIAPEDNRLIVFPSDAFHEVTPIHTPTDDPRDGRLTVNGWIHEVE
ncbi:MAG: 2OG-Fe(II) oxygenase [Azospirillaceae bacterium]